MKNNVKRRYFLKKYSEVIPKMFGTTSLHVVENYYVNESSYSNPKYCSVGKMKT